MPIEVPVTLTALGASPQPATATVLRQSQGQRLARALTGLAMFWGPAVLAAFIPVAHLVLVPALLVAGAVAAVRRGREDQRLLGVRGACPRCGVEQEFRPGGRFAGVPVFDCPHCHDNIRLLGDPDPA